jgi:Outer membrane protein beta-barrel domain
MYLKKSGLEHLLVAGMAICMLCCVAIGQTNEKEVHVGVKAGISLPNIVGGGGQEITRDYKSRLAPNFGGYVEWGVKRRFSVVTEVDYAPQGGKRNGVQPITSPIPGLPPLPAGSYYFADFKNTAKLNYLEVPVLFKYRWGKGSHTGFYVNAGPYFGFLLKATQVTSGTSSVFTSKTRTPLPFPFPAIPFDAKTDVTASLHRFNFGVAGGGGITFPSADNYFFIDVRASYGLTTLQKNTITDGKSRTGNLVISFGYAFKVNRK